MTDMRTILITGGASGIGKGIARHYLSKGDRVIAVGTSARNGEFFCSEDLQFGAGTERAVFIQADLSLIAENKRIIEEIKNGFLTIDMLIFCASRHCKEYSETAEGLEFSFALDYLSRFLLIHGLKECLEKADNPVIMNVCGTGMMGEINREDLQHKNSFNPMKVMMHGSRLNELSAVAFTKNDTVGKIKYVLYNPMAVQTPGMTEFGNGLMKRL
jgi:NAD(P)-dependent dehydrogenase (short-subunit alcohol dehydrogenase family)